MGVQSGHSTALWVSARIVGNSLFALTYGMSGRDND